MDIQHKAERSVDWASRSHDFEGSETARQGVSILRHSAGLPQASFVPSNGVFCDREKKQN